VVSNTIQKLVEVCSMVRITIEILGDHIITG